ncbi:unnamed protein product [Ixodes pacificus]
MFIRHNHISSIFETVIRCKEKSKQAFQKCLCIPMSSIRKKVCKAEARTTLVRIIFLDGHKIVAQHSINKQPTQDRKKKKKFAHAKLCLQVWKQHNYQYQQMICETFPLHVENLCHCTYIPSFLRFNWAMHHERYKPALTN